MAVADIHERLRALEERLHSLEEELDEQPRVYNAQIVDLGESQYRLVCPLLVTVEVYAAEVVASLPEFDLYASGVSDAVALARLKGEIVSAYERLVELGPDRLGPLPLRWLAALNRVLDRADA